MKFVDISYSFRWFFEQLIALAVSLAVDLVGGLETWILQLVIEIYSFFLQEHDMENSDKQNYAS